MKSRRRLRPALLCLPVLVATSVLALHPEFTTLDLTYQTPHLPFLKNAAHGPVKVLFLSPANQTLGHVREIVQRADIDCDYFAVPVNGKIPEEKELAEFAKKLTTTQPDVLVILGIDGDTGLGKALLDDVFKRVQAGLGLVAYARTADLKTEPTYAEHLTALTAITDDPQPAVAVGLPIVRRFQVGQGRVVLLVGDSNSYRDNLAALLRGWTQINTVTTPQDIPEFHWRGFEYTYAALGQYIQWAGRKDSSVVITGATLTGPTLQVNIHNPGPNVTAVLQVSIRSRRWEVQGTGQRSVELTQGKTAVPVALDTPPEAGPLSAEIFLRDQTGKLLAFASAGVSPPALASVKVTPGDIYTPAGQPVPCTIELLRATNGPARADLKLSLVDSFGRLVYQGVLADVPLDQALKTAIPMPAPQSTYHELVAELWSTGEPSRRLAETVANVYLIPPTPDYETGFALGVYGAPERDPLHIQGLFPSAWTAGWTLHSHSFYDPLAYSTGLPLARADRIVAPGSHHPHAQDRFALTGGAKLDKPHLIMEPALVPQLDSLSNVQQAFQSILRTNLATGKRTTLIDDERELNEDYDFNPQTLAAFRQWLAKRYGNIAALNQTWETNFSDFATVLPTQRSELPGWPHVRNLAPWLEFRLFIAEVLGEYYIKLPAEWAAAVDPAIAIGEFGIYPPNGFSRRYPVDWSRYAHWYRRTTTYPNLGNLLGDYFRAFAPTSIRGPWTGYYMYATLKPGRRIAPWTALFNGEHWCWYWELRSPGLQGYAMTTSDQRLTQAYADFARDEVPDLTGGIDKLVFSSRFVDDGIALAYSFPSLLRHPDGLLAEPRDPLKEIGLQYSFMTMEDVAAGRLQQAGSKLLIAAELACLSDAEARAVRRFVEDGGVFFGMGQLGGYDLRGAPAPENGLADLAGIDMRAAAPSTNAVSVTFEGKSVPVFLAYNGVLTKDATILASATLEGQPLPVFTRVARGKGQIYWLNTSFGTQVAYFSQVNAKIAEAIKAANDQATQDATLKDKTEIEAQARSATLANQQFIAAVAHGAGLQPKCRFFKDGQPFSDHPSEVWYYQSPSARSWYVGRYVFTNVTLDVRFQKPAHLYDLRAHKYLGQTDAVTQDFKPGEVHVYALLDYQVTGLQTTLSTPVTKPGATLRLTCQITTANGQLPDLHALRVSRTGPDGQLFPGSKKVILAPDGRSELEIPLALNEPLGTQIVTVLDVISGFQSTTTFSVAGKVAPAIITDLSTKPTARKEANSH